jgi:hypothetical protein
VQASTSSGDGATKSVSVKSLLAFASPDADAGDGGSSSDQFEVGNGAQIVSDFKDVFKQDNPTILENGQFNTPTPSKLPLSRLWKPKLAPTLVSMRSGQA